MKPSRIAIASISLACLLAAPAQAAMKEASASASITNITISLVDLDPLDGITPWIDYSAMGDQGQAQPYTLRHRAFVSAYDQGSRPRQKTDSAVADSQAGAQGPISPMDLSKTGEGRSSRAWSTEDSISAQAWAQVQRRVDKSDLTTEHDRSAGAQVTNFPVTYDSLTYGLDPKTIGGFLLSPNTRIVVQGAFAVSTGPGTEADARVTGSLSNGVNSYDGFFAKSVRSTLVSKWDGPYDDPTPKSGEFTLTLDNLTSSQSTGFLRFSAQASAWAAAAVVPEPETWALMCAGLATSLIWRTRRNRSSQAAG